MDLEDIDLKLDVHFIIKELLKEKLITQSDLEAVDLYFSGFYFKEIASILNRDWRVVQSSINNFIYLVKQRSKDEILCNM